MNSPETSEAVLRVTRAEQDRIDHARDQTIAERLDEIERVLKFDPGIAYRRELIREYLALTTDPDEARRPS